MESREMALIKLLQSRNRDANVENKPADTVGEGGGDELRVALTDMHYHA